MTDPLTPLTPEQEQQAEASALKEGYLHRVIKAEDMALNVDTDGLLDQSISSRVGLDAAKGNKFAKLFAGFLNLFERNHVVLAESADKAQAELVVKTEEASPDLPPETLP